MKNPIVNELIPADSLHWSEDDGKFVVLSGKEIDKILIACYQNGMEDFDEMMKMIRWAEQIRTGNKLLNEFIKQNVAVTIIDEDGEPHFVRKDLYDEYLKTFRPLE
jgi:hypothetical protein